MNFLENNILSSHLAIAYTLYVSLCTESEPITQKEFLELYKNNEYDFRALLGVD